MISGAVHPRAGGEHDHNRVLINRLHGSSPRRRGTRKNISHPDISRRFIPAQAGNTMAKVRVTGTPSVHPRAGGEHSSHK
ncbi:Hypothetical protein GbCGDNIH5_1373 [Granulibacter bethesdensis]|nr:Hypothetical protein GbCGDNIH5_1373 [Granulibacter bethesdensis]